MASGPPAGEFVSPSKASADPGVVPHEEPAPRAGGEEAQQAPLAEQGFNIFHDDDFGSTGIACADCHNDFPDSLLHDRIKPGHSILGAADRRSAWYGEFEGEELQTTAAGAAKCALIYQERGESLESALSAAEADALLSYFRYVSPEGAGAKNRWRALSYPGDPAFKRDSILVIVDSLNELRGDAARGEALFESACAPCHSGGPNAVAPNPRYLRRYVNRVFLYVRAGKGIMPFFSYDKLSDPNVADIREWLKQGAR